MKNQTNHKEVTNIKEVTENEEYYFISTSEGFGIGMAKSYGFIPKAGDEFTVHTKGSLFGTVFGMELNGVKVFHKTDEELEQERLDWLANNEKEKQENFKENVSEMDADYNSLPKCFQERIDKFRANNERFRIDYEGYELFCCKEAVKIANHCKTPEAIQDFKALDWEKQKEVISDGHSGNTFGCACSLAFWYLSNPENVAKTHGALSPLVGSEEYGDVKKSSDTNPNS